MNTGSVETVLTLSDSDDDFGHGDVIDLTVSDAEDDDSGQRYNFTGNYTYSIINKYYLPQPAIFNSQPTLNPPFSSDISDCVTSFTTIFCRNSKRLKQQDNVDDSTNCTDIRLVVNMKHSINLIN
jgi:hypothetical protein